MAIVNHICVLSVAVALVGGSVLADEPVVKPAAPGATAPAAKPEVKPEVKPEGKEGDKAAEKKAMTAAERLAACAKVYAEAKTYWDEGMITTEMDVSGQMGESPMPFATAFERGGRFRWQFRHGSAADDEPTKRFTIWSVDGKTFNQFWTLDGKLEKTKDLSMPLAGATGISRGGALVVIPMLGVGTQPLMWGGKSTDIVNPKETGKEAVDGVECWKIEGKQKISNFEVSIWIDAEGLIRKRRDVMVVDPAAIPDARRNGRPAIPKFTSTTTISIKPHVNEAKIEDAKFAPDEKPAAEGKK